MIGSSMSGPGLKVFWNQIATILRPHQVEIGQSESELQRRIHSSPVFLKVSAKSSSKATLANANSTELGIRYQSGSSFGLLNELSTHPSRNPAVLLSAQAGFFRPLQDGVNPGQATHLQFLSQFENGSRSLAHGSLAATHTYSCLRHRGSSQVPFIDFRQHRRHVNFSTRNKSGRWQPWRLRC
ncbi:hypothetical protein AB0V79_27750 [Mesorhizobium ciceri]|uniref:hypothetical protein n=1 Tax=Mesorhizobium TaxID=68287 RepID=UPI00157DC981|nr:hypothetical protein [Mesorhizobium ciceri]